MDFCQKGLINYMSAPVVADKEDLTRVFPLLQI